MKRHTLSLPSQPQRGAATLVVVMVLFLVMALLAAYANRSLVFEQRISGSYYRASMAQEMAEGGLEWTVAMLNGTGIDGDCKAVSTGGTRFVDKYLSVAASDRYTKGLATNGSDVVADCASKGNALVCRCPTPTATHVAQPATASSNGSPVPSMGIAVGSNTAAYRGTLQLTSTGCTDSSNDYCSNPRAQVLSQRVIGAAQHNAYVALVAAVPSSPPAPLVVKGTLTTAGVGGLGLHNTDSRSAGTLVVSGGPAPVLDDARMDSVPGTPPDQARNFDDSYLFDLHQNNTTENKTRFFRTFMGLSPSRYGNHPAARTVTCPTSGGCETNLVNAYNAGQRMLIVNGPMTISSNAVIGSVTAPVLIVVYGPMVITGPMQLNGMLVVLGGLDWTNTGGLTSQITGMVLVQDNMRTNGRMDIVYQQSIANDLRNRLGSYVRVPGGWIDGTSTN